MNSVRLWPMKVRRTQEPNQAGPKVTLGWIPEPVEFWTRLDQPIGPLTLWAQLRPTKPTDR
jgi:hypothetical protein